jgi:SEC-C motif-containing protein
MQIINRCFCGAFINYQLCCGRFIDNKETPTTAEELMRSRYSAYVQTKIGYIQQTMTGPAACGFNPQEAFNWAKTLEWLGLEVIRSFQKENKNQAFVEFVATYKKTDGSKQQLHELSEFKLIEKRWFYYDGKIILSSNNKSYLSSNE